MVVELKVDGTLREESGLVGPDLVEDEFCPVLRYHARDERAVGDIIEFCGPRVDVRGVHAAWPEETDGCETWDQLGRDSAQKAPRTDRDIIPDGSGHSDGIGGRAETTCACGLSSRRVQEVELERIVREEIEPRKVGWGLQEARDKLGIPLGDGGGESDSGKDEKPRYHRQGG